MASQKKSDSCCAGDGTHYRDHSSEAEPAAQQESEVEYMVRRFLMWRLPENFNPDAGISFKPTFNENTAWGPDKHNPVGTNLFDYTQAKEMVQFMLEGMPAIQAEPAPTPSRADMTQDYDSYCDLCGAGHHCKRRRDDTHWKWCEGDPSPSCWEGDKAAEEGQFMLTSVVAEVTCEDCKSHLEITKNLREVAGK